MKNFEFEYNGKKYWYSRSMTGVMYAFCKNKEGKWCILASQRGPGCPTCVGFWNVPCGYCDHNESIWDCVVRECKEETGVEIPRKKIKLYHLYTTPKGKKQNYNTSFYAKLSGITDFYKTSDAFNEPDETSAIKWIPIEELSNYQFAFEQKPHIMDIYKRYIYILPCKRMLLKVSEWLYKKLRNNQIM